MSHSDEEGNLGRDSFELQSLNIPSEVPPAYNEDDAGFKGGQMHDKASNAGSTLFELGDDEENEHSRSNADQNDYEALDDDESNDRLKK